MAGVTVVHEGLILCHMACHVSQHLTHYK